MNPSIRTTLVHIPSLVELEKIVDKAKEGVSFFGHSYIYLDGYSGTLSINALALSVMLLVEKKIDFNQNPAERNALNAMIPKISAIYAKNDNRWPPPLAPLFAMPEFWNYVKVGGYDTRFYWQMDYEDYGFNFSRKNYPLPSDLRPLVTKEEIPFVLAHTDSFKDLLAIVKKAKEDISFFGCRFTYFENYDGTLTTHALASRVMEVAKTLPHFKQDKNYQEIVSRIDAIYLSNKERKKEKNLFTRMLSSIRDIWNDAIQRLTDGSRSQWEQHKKK